MKRAQIREGVTYRRIDGATHRHVDRIDGQTVHFTETKGRCYGAEREQLGEPVKRRASLDTFAHWAWREVR